MTNKVWRIRILLCIAIVFGPWFYVVVGDYESFPYSTFPMFSYFKGNGSQSSLCLIYQVNEGGSESLIENQRFLWPSNRLWLTVHCQFLKGPKNKAFIEPLMDYYASRATYFFKDYSADEKPLAIRLKRFTSTINLTSKQIEVTSPETVLEKLVKHD